MSRRNPTSETVIYIKFQKGLADRKRLPLAHVLSVLEEFRQMIAEVGRAFQFRKGIPNPTGDFGLEILAGPHGAVFRPGSLETPVVITQDVQTGILATQHVIKTIGTLESDKFPPPEDEEIDRYIVRRLNRIAHIQQTDKIETYFAVKRPGFPRPMAATFGATAAAMARAMQAPTFQMEGMTLYGKLYELADRSPSEEDTGKYFWGELRRENGEVWRVRFKSEDLPKVVPLFRKQVVLTGTAYYYRVAGPKLVAEQIDQDKDRDFEEAFEQLLGCYKDIYKADFRTLMKRMHGEE